MIRRALASLVRPRFAGRPRTFAAVITALAAAYVLAGFFLAPALLRRQVIGRTEKLLHLRPTVRAVRVNPLALSVTLRGVEIPGRDGSPLLGFEELHVNFSPSGSLFRWAWSFSTIRLRSPIVHAEFAADRTLNLMQLVPPPAGAPRPPAEAPKPLPRLWVGQLELQEGRVQFRDLSRGPAIETAMLPVHIVLTRFSTRRDANNAYTFAAVSRAGEELQWNGTFNVQPFRSEGRFVLRKVQLATLDNYLREFLAFQPLGGSFDIEARYRLDASIVPAAFEVLGGQLAARDIALADRGSDFPVITVPELALQDVTASTARSELVVGSARSARGTIVTWFEPGGVVNFQKWSQPPVRSAPAADPLAVGPSPVGAAPNSVAIPGAATASRAGSPPRSAAPPGAGGATGAAPRSQPAVWVVRIGETTIQDYTLVAEDRQLPRPAHVELRRIELQVQDYSTAPGSRCRATGTCTLDSTGSVRFSGEMSLVPPRGELELEVQNADLRVLQPYVDTAAKIDLVRGTADAKGTLQFDAESTSGPRARFTGEATSRRLRVTDRILHEDFLRWETLRLTGLRYQAQPDSLQVDEVVATRAYARVVVGPDRRTNIQNLMITPADSATGTAGTTAPRAVAKQPLPARIGLVRIVDSAAQFGDLSMTPKFSTGIEQLQGTVEGLSSEKLTRAAVRLDGKVDTYAPVSIAGEVNLLSETPYTNLSLRFEGIELTTFTPYSGRFAGYTIERGKLNLDLEYEVENRQLKGENKIFLDQLTLGAKTGHPDATSLPIRFAIALLKDRHGNIDLDVPVEGSLDDPQFSLMRIVWKVLKNLIVKAVTSPFKLLGALVGGDDQELGHVEFEPGTDSLTIETRGRLDALHKGLLEKQELRLLVAQAADPTRDGRVLQRAELGRQLAAARSDELRQAGKPAPALDEVALAPADSLRLLSRLYAASYGAAPELPPPPKGRRPAETPEQQAARLAAEASARTEMVTRLLADVPVDTAALQALGLARAQRVRDHLLADGALAPARIFIVQTPAAAAPAGERVRLDFTLEAE